MPPDRVHAECIERIVVAEHVLQAGAAPVADGAGRDADGTASRPVPTKPDAGRDGDKARDGSGADADHRRLAARASTRRSSR